MSRLAGDQVHIDTQQGRRRVEAAFHRGGEDDVAVAGEGQPAVLGQLLLQLPRRPAGVAEGDQVFLRPLVSRDGAKDVAVVAVASVRQGGSIFFRIFMKANQGGGYRIYFIIIWTRLACIDSMHSIYTDMYEVAIVNN